MTEVTSSDGGSEAAHWVGDGPVSSLWFGDGSSSDKCLAEGGIPSGVVYLVDVSIRKSFHDGGVDLGGCYWIGFGGFGGLSQGFP